MKNLSCQFLKYKTLILIKLFKKYRGSASRDSKGNDKNVEGNHKVIPYKGKTARILTRYLWLLKMEKRIY